MRKSLAWALPIVALALVLFLARTTSAQKFRYGTISWQQVTGGAGRTVQFTLQTAWTRSQYTAATAVGVTVSETGSYFYPDYSVRNSVFWTSLPLLITAISTNEDWFLATTNFSYSYAADATFYAYFSSAGSSSSKRLTTLINNPSRNFAVHTKVNVVFGMTTKSIITSTSPIVAFANNTNTRFSLASQSFQNEFIRYRLANSDEAAGVANTYTQVPGLGIDFTSGVITWWPIQTGFYSIQVVIMGFSVDNNNPNDYSQLSQETSVDFLLNVIVLNGKYCSRTCSTPLGTVCTSDSNCGGCGVNSCRTNFEPNFSLVTINAISQNITSLQSNFALTLPGAASAGREFNITVTATDSNTDDWVNISTSGNLPTGSTITRDCNACRTQTVTFKWTPSVTSSGSIVCFTATDTMFFSNRGLLCVRISVTTGDLSASGSGLTQATAGVEGSVSIVSPTNRLIMTIVGSSQTATAVISCTSSCSNNALSTYTARYNVAGVPSSALTISGYYIVNITEFSSGLKTIQFSMRVSSNTITVVNQTLLYDLGSTGLTGGNYPSVLYSYITARDIFGNVQTASVGDSFKVVLNSSTTNQVYPCISMGSGRYNFSYVVPMVPSGSNTDMPYSLTVYFSNPSQGLYNVNVTRITALSLFTTFNVFFSPTVLSITAGQPLNFNVTTADSTPRLLTIMVTYWVVTRQGDLCAGTADVGYFDTLSISSGPLAVHQITPSLSFMKARNYLNGITVVGTGLATNSSKKTFSVKESNFAGSSSVICGLDSSFVAGSTGTISVYLRDSFFNLLTSVNYSIGYNYTVSPSTSSQLVPPVVKGTVTTYGDDGSYSLNLMSVVAGTINIFFYEVSTGATIGSGLYQRVINPGDFSFSRSSLSGVFNIIAGDESSFSITSMDQYGNERSNTVDYFRMSMSLTKNEQTYYAYISSFVQTPNSGKYTVKYNATVAGSYSCQIEILNVLYNEYVTYNDPKVVVTASDVVGSAGFVDVSGSGVSGGSGGDIASIMVRLQDKFGNYVESQRNGFVLAVITMKTSKTYYGGWFCSPGASTCPKSSPRAILSSDIDFEDYLSDEETLLSEDGFWRVKYIVPEVPIDGTKQFTIQIYWCNASDYTQGDTGDAIAARSTLVYESISTTAAVGQVAAINIYTDNWQVVTIGICVGSFFFTFVSYGTWRLTRYRAKYVVEKMRADKAERELVEMGKEVDVIPNKDWGTADTANLTANPLCVMPAPAQVKKNLDAVDDPKIKMTSDRNIYRKEFKPQVAHARGPSHGAVDL